MNKRVRFLALPALTLAIAAALPAQAAIVLADGSAYTQDFDALAAGGSPSWINDSTIAGWSLFISSGAAPTTYSAGDGSGNAGAFWSYGSSGSGDRALGSLGSGGTYFGSPASGAVAGWIAVAFTNGSGADFSGFTVGFDGEQWRNGGNTSAQPTVLQYGFGSSFGAVGNWVTPGGSFTWSSPVVGSSAAAVNGNAAGLVSGVGGSIATGWAAGQTLWLRWVELNDVGNDHGLAIDDFSFSATTVPEPGSMALLAAGLACVGFLARRRG